MKNQDFIIVGLQPWDIEIGSNCKNIATELSKKNRVLYVNRALDRFTAWKQKKDSKTTARLASIKGKSPAVKKIQTNLWTLDPKVIVESVNKLPGPLFRLLNKRNNRLIAGEIEAAVDQLGFHNPVLLIDNDFFRCLHLPQMLDVKSSVYYIRDFLTSQPYFRKHGPGAEQALIKSCDLVVSNSQYLANYASRFNPASYDIGQGCDFSNFSIDNERVRPQDLPVGKPIIGYVGAIVSSRLDEQLLFECAVASPHLNWVFVGPMDKSFTQSRLHGLTNVVFSGAKPEKELSDYIHHFDVCINPQLVNELTVGNYPRKIDEYLAMGKPVVATMTEFMKSFESYVTLCSGTQEYLKGIEESLASRSQEQVLLRRQFALTHTWENSVAKLCNLIKQ